MQRANQKYYSGKGKAIYGDFSTFAQGRALADCNAIEFCRDFPNRSGGIIVCEYGVGSGNFARVFLDEVKSRNPKLYSRTRYLLFDISEKMLSDAKNTLAAHAMRCKFAVFDASSDLPSQEFDYCRINELLSDLPAEVYARKGNSAPTSNIFVQKFLSRMDNGRKIPFPFVAEKFLMALCSAGRKNCRVDVFDYGFHSPDDIFLHPVDEWNGLFAREYGGQVTVDLNFLQLSSALQSAGFKASVERQKEYAERVLGEKLMLDDSDGKLDYVKKEEKDEIDEDDGFYHLRVEC
jgi:hypothetical protein